MGLNNFPTATKMIEVKTTKIIHKLGIQLFIKCLCLVSRVFLKNLYFEVVKSSQQMAQGFWFR